jgi:hypothetical protein
VRCVWLSLIIAGAMTGPGLAADLPVAVKAAPPAATPFSWSWNYVGLNVGGAWGSFDFDPSTINNLTGIATDSGSTRQTGDGVTGGFQTGRKWQFGSWVLGIENQTQLSNLKQTLTIASPAGALRPGDSFTDKTDVLKRDPRQSWLGVGSRPAVYDRRPRNGSKYPLAEPGALRVEPLKAASGTLRGPDR